MGAGDAGYPELESWIRVGARSRESEVRCGQVGHLFLMHAEGTADPSTSLRFGRDDAVWVNYRLGDARFS
jgi:hypothetical protein